MDLEKRRWEGCWYHYTFLAPGPGLQLQVPEAEAIPEKETVALNLYVTVPKDLLGRLCLHPIWQNWGATERSCIAERSGQLTLVLHPVIIPPSLPVPMEEA